MKHTETVYGEGILEHELSALGSYVLVTSGAPWGLFKHRFDRFPPAKVLFPESHEQSVLDEQAPGIPDDAEIVGMGGGTIIDNAKYFAYLRNKKPVLVPTITSSNAPYHDSISVRRGGTPTGLIAKGWPKRVVVDYSLIRKADPRLNRAGYGDLLYFKTTLEDWRIAHAKGRGVPYDPRLGERIEGLMREAVEQAAEIGSVSDRGIREVMRLFEATTELILDDLSRPIAAGSEHLFAWNLENVTRRHFIHGEIVSLGILISAFLQNNGVAELKQALDRAQIVYQPEKLGIAWNEIADTLVSLEKYNREVRRYHTVFEDIEWTSALLGELREIVYS